MTESLGLPSWILDLVGFTIWILKLVGISFWILDLVEVALDNKISSWSESMFSTRLSIGNLGSLGLLLWILDLVGLSFWILDLLGLTLWNLNFSLGVIIKNSFDLNLCFLLDYQLAILEA